jgi:hypothetical protein
VIVSEPGAELDGISEALTAFANPKSSTFTLPSGVNFTLAGFRSDLRGDAQRLGDVQAAGVQALCERGTFDQFQHQKPGAVGVLRQMRRHVVLEAVNGGDVGVIELRQYLRLALKTNQPGRIAHELRGQDLQCNITLQFGVVRTIDLAHPPHAQRHEHLVMLQSSSSRNGHKDCVILQPASRQAQLVFI